MDHQGTHDMSGHCGGGGHGSTFHHSTSAVLLFNGLNVGPDVFSYYLACFAIILAGIIRQDLVRMSEQEIHTNEKRALLYFAQATISYLLMLIAMTFNVGLFLSVMIGLSLGFYRSLVQQGKIKAECCA